MKESAKYNKTNVYHLERKVLRNIFGTFRKMVLLKIVFLEHNKTFFCKNKSF